MRATKSVTLPAENGTSMRIGFTGNFSSAPAAPVASSNATASNFSPFFINMGFSSLSFYCVEMPASFTSFWYLTNSARINC